MNKPVSYLRSSLFFTVFYVSIIVHAIVCLLLMPWLPVKKRFKFVVLLNRFVVRWFAFSCGVKYRFEGIEQLAGQSSAVIVSNHQSEWETFYLQTLVSPLCTVLKKELLRIPFFGWGLALIKPIAIDRSVRTSALRQVLQQGRQRLQDGFWVLIFPEGTRVRAGGKSKFSKTGALLAVESGVPLIPIVHNAGQYWPTGKFCKSSGVLRLIVGPAIATQDRSVEEVHREASAWMQSQLELLSGAAAPAAS